MPKDKKEILEFGPFRLDRAEALLTRLGTPVPLPPKVFDLLSYLASNPGRLIEKEELLKALWPDSFVEEANLTVNIAALRRALGSQPDGHPWIETVPKRGYRFLAIVAHPAEPAEQGPVTEPPAAPPPVVEPVTARGRSLVAVAALALVVVVAYLYVYAKRGRQVHSSRGSLLAIQGNLKEAVQEARMALNLDPFNYQYVGELAWTLYLNREYEAAIKTLDEYTQRDSRYRVDWDRFYCYLKMSRVAEAITLMENALTSQGPNQSIAAVLAHAYALKGDLAKTQELLKTLPKDWGYYQRAVVDLVLGDRDAALAHLDQAVDERSVFVEWLKVDPDLEPLRGDPRFARIVARVGLTP